MVANLFGEGDFNIVISANNRLLVHQTTTRMASDLISDADSTTEESDDIVTGEVFSWMSGSKKNNISAIELSTLITWGEVGMVILCAHKRRVTYLADMLAALERHRFAKRINIWIDEADASENIWGKFSHVIASPLISQVTMVSATYDAKFFKKYPMSIIPFQVTHPECYRCLKDSRTFVEDFLAKQAPEYVKAVLDKYPHLIHPGARAFIPGNNARATHDEVCDFLVSKGFVVLILNGKRKEMVFPDGRIIDLSAYLTVDSTDNVPEEFNKTLAKIYTQNRLDQYPFAITGYICVERGVTFQIAPSEDHDGFMFDYGIISPITDCMGAYQAMARLFGNIGHFPDYKPCAIYSNTATFAKVRKQEEIAVNLSRLIYDEGMEHETVTKALLDRAADPDKDVKWGEPTIHEFATLAEVNAHIKATKSGNRRAEPDKNESGFYMSSTTHKKDVMNYDDTLREIRGWSKTANFGMKSDEPANKSYSRLYVAYRDTTDITSVVFIVRTIQPKGPGAAGGAGRASPVTTNPFE